MQAQAATEAESLFPQSGRERQAAVAERMFHVLESAMVPHQPPLDEQAKALRNFQDGITRLISIRIAILQTIEVRDDALQKTQRGLEGATTRDDTVLQTLNTKLIEMERTPDEVKQKSFNV
ncbi:hypothetical protein PsorP6_015188 [Peronosclerospora sorghi]|uniref:Uncharacterized protein n=1 Tax=Peronosclerospora sorghi TaxID=230839 RepID=A0ACC0VTX6_9STRA|nr:hypothetical protein PsorP6_015188 [Peronosclerospora sorghi]